MARIRSRARVRTVIDPNSVPDAAIPGVAHSAISTNPTPTWPRSSANRSAAAGITTNSTTTRKASTPMLLPAKMALRAAGATKSPSSAPSSRSRCQVRPRASTAAKAMEIQITPDAMSRRVVGPP